GVLVLLLLFFAVVAIGSSFLTSSACETLRSGREVSVKTDSFFLSCSFSDDVATIRSGSKQILVQPDALVVDGDTFAIDPAVSDVRVSIKNGEVTFWVDGETA
ncbi:MAG: hypothetical protein AAFU85_09585, partial [Planctomycetota bacterium]